MLEEKDILVREFKGADSINLLSYISDYISALWINPIYNVDNETSFPKFITNFIDNQEPSKIATDFIIYARLQQEAVKLIASFAVNSKTDTEYKNANLETIGMDELIIVIKAVLTKFFAKFKNTVFYQSLKNQLIYEKNSLN